LHRVTIVILILSILAGCSMLVGWGPSVKGLEAVDYPPLPGDDWKISAPAEQGLDHKLVAKLYFNAAKMEILCGRWVMAAIMGTIQPGMPPKLRRSTTCWKER
jgi:hypothetical protein